jgi:oligoribonuclease NrnB/cAMP/cGMP phosphodiesterase (DHH superfamily)
MNLTKPLIIYHGNCADGFTSAWLANMAYGEKHPDLAGHIPNGWVVDHHAGVYGKPPPDITGREVYILDFSYPPEVMKVICDEALHVTHIDHHISAIKAMADFEHPRYECHFDDQRCGAWLTSKFFWPDRDPNRMTELVDDRDRWVFRFPQTRPFHASLFSRPYAIGEWNKLNSEIPEAIMEGKAIDRKHFKDINELLDVCMQMELFDDVMVPVVNLPYTMASDACAIMLDRVPEAPYAVAWYMRADDKMVFSLRSRADEDVDVSVIAKKFGGGGHKNAAGCATDGWPITPQPVAEEF